MEMELRSDLPEFAEIKAMTEIEPAATRDSQFKIQNLKKLD